MASGRQVEYRLQLTSNAVGVLGQADAAANKFENSMLNVQRTLSSFGLGLGAYFLADAAKGLITLAADYESAMLRIKNASENNQIGILNQEFVTKQVDHFKLKLNETLDAYGDFLFKIKNTSIPSDVKNKIFEELNIIGKVAGLPQSKVDQITYDLATQLGAGVLETRQLRPLINLHPNYAPFIAQELGLKDYIETERSKQLHVKNIGGSTAVEQLFQGMSNMQLTKAAIPSIDILLPALEKYVETLKSKLPEALNTTQSALNHLSSTWDNFKDNLVLDDKPELINFFKSLESGIKWLVDHEEGIIRTGRAIADSVKLYAEWRIALMAVQIPGAIIGFAANERDRFNNVFGIGGGINQVQSNTILSASIDKVTSSEAKEIETLSILEEKVQLATVQQDLFTESQIASVAATEKLKDEYIQLDLYSADAFRGFGILNAKGQSGYNAALPLYRTTTENAAQVIIANENVAKTYGAITGAEEAATVQGGLFAKAQMDAMVSSESLTEKLILENEQMLLNNELMATNVGLLNSYAIGGINSTVAGFNNKLSGIGNLLSSAIMPVFIAGMALEVADALIPENKLEKKGLGISNWLNTGIYNPRLLGNGDDIFDYYRKLQVNNSIQEDLNNSVPQNILPSLLGGWSNLSNGVKIDPKGNNLYNLLFAEQQNLNAQNVIENIFDLLLPLDEYGKRNTDNASIFRALRSHNFNLPFFLDDSTPGGIPDYIHQHTAGTKGVNIGAADPKHIRGNSSNYFTTHIQGGVNGMVNPVFKQVDGTTMTDVKQEVGLQIAAMLEDVINDVQISK